MKVLAWWAPAVVAGLVLAAVALARPAGRRLTDLSVYLGAVDGTRRGDSLYDFVRVDAPFTYPPFAGLLFRPLLALPVPVVQVCWSLATVAVVLGLAALFTRPAARPAARPAPRRGSVGSAFVRQVASFPGRGGAPLLALVLMLSLPVSSNLRFGQISLFLAALVAVDFLLLDRTRAHGVLVGLCAAIKLTPLIFVPLLWCTGRRRAAGLAAATFAACGALAALVLPGDSWRFWTAEVMRVERIGYLTDVGNQSLNGALMRFAVPGQLRLPIVVLVGGALVAAALWAAVRLDRGGDRRAALILTGVAGLVLSPVSWTHHQLWLALAVLLPMTVPARMLVLALAVLPATALGGPVWTNTRVLLAMGIVMAQVVRCRRVGEGGAGGRAVSDGEVGDRAVSDSRAGDHALSDGGVRGRAVSDGSAGDHALSGGSARDRAVRGGSAGDHALSDGGVEGRVIVGGAGPGGAEVAAVAGTSAGRSVARLPTRRPWPGAWGRSPVR